MIAAAAAAAAVFFFFQLESLRQPCFKQVSQHYFSNSICLLHVFVSRFGDSHNISNSFIVTVFVMVTSVSDR